MASMDDLFDQAVQQSGDLEGAGSPYLTLDQFHERYGVSRFLDVGYPSYNLHLMTDGQGNYGMPYGRVIEISGKESTLKTTMCLEVLAENVRQGGHSYLIQDEFDFNKEYAGRFLRKRGVDTPFKELKYTATGINSVSQLAERVKATLAPYKAMADELEKDGKNPRKELPPVVICVDSIGALVSEIERETYEDDFDDDPKRATKATDLHKFFKMFLEDFGRLGVLFLFTNHLRANMDYGNKKYSIAHDSALRHYCSLRIQHSKGYKRSMKNDKSDNNVSYRRGFPLEVEIKKIRDDHTGKDQFEIPYFYQKGLDKLQSIMDAAHLTDVARWWGGTFQLELDEDNELSEFNDNYSPKKFRRVLKENPKLRNEIERLSYEAGPRQVVDEGDMEAEARGGKM